jgi:hypothetical protein
MPSPIHFITKIVGRSEGELSDSHRVGPKEFLAWAEKDLAAGDRRGLGNSLGNIKKSLHCRIDQIIAKTHVRFTRDWNPKRVTTQQKLNIIGELGVQHEAIVDVLTSARNDYEHDYVLPNPRLVRAHLHAAQLWIEKSYSAYEFHPVGFADLPLRGISSGSKQPKGSSISMAKFGDPQRVVCFLPAMKSVLTIQADGTEETVEFRSLDFKGMLRIEGPFIRDSLAGRCRVAVNEAGIMDLLDRYRAWLRGRCARIGQPTSCSEPGDDALVEN